MKYFNNFRKYVENYNLIEESIGQSKKWLKQKKMDPSKSKDFLSFLKTSFEKNGSLDFAEKYAREKKFASVRLDTFSVNKRNLKFYESRGYQRLEGIYFPKQSEFPFYCYELIL